MGFVHWGLLSITGKENLIFYRCMIKNSQGPLIFDICSFINPNIAQECYFFVGRILCMEIGTNRGS